MKTRMTSVALALLGILGPVTVSVAATLQEAEKAIIDRTSKYKTLQYKSKYTQSYQSKDYSMKSSGTTASEYKRKGKKSYLSRIEMKSKGTQTVQGQPEKKTDVSSLMILDGQFYYTYFVQGDQKTATKNKIDPKTQIDPFDTKAIFKQMHKTYDMQLLPDKTVDGQPTYVIESTLKKKGNPVLGRTVTYYDKKTGMSLKTVSYDSSGKVGMTSITTDIKIDAPISDDRFVFKAPPGVQVTDMTKQSTSAQRTAKADAKEDKKEDEKPKEKKKKKKKNPLKSLFNKLK